MQGTHFIFRNCAKFSVFLQSHSPLLHR